MWDVKVEESFVCPLHLEIYISQAVCQAEKSRGRGAIFSLFVAAVDQQLLLKLSELQLTVCF